MEPSPDVFQVILSLSIGKSLEEIRRMTAKDVSRYRRFYALCPFGPARSDINAWLTAQHVWAGWNGSSKTLAESVLWFGRRKKRTAKTKTNPGNSGRKMVEAELEAGRKVEFRDAQGNQIPMPDWAAEIYAAGLAKHGKN